MEIVTTFCAGLKAALEEADKIPRVPITLKGPYDIIERWSSPEAFKEDERLHWQLPPYCGYTLEYSIPSPCPRDCCNKRV